MTGNQELAVADQELLDSTEATSFRFAPIDMSLLTSGVVLKAFGGLAIGLALLIWPDRNELVFARLIGVGLVWFAVASFRSMRFRSTKQRQGFKFSRLIVPVAALAPGVVLAVVPARSTDLVGRVTGALLLLYVARTIYDQWRSDERNWSGLPALSVIATLAIVLFFVTSELLAIIVTIGALLLVAASVLVLAIALDGRTEGAANFSDISNFIQSWLGDRPKSLEARQDLYNKILYEGPTTRLRVIRFFSLMGFASVIASMGVITDSTAVVIGAMLIAPLMTPLMGMAISLVMGWPNRLLRAFAIAVSGIAFAIAIGVLIGLFLGADTATNTQILARVSPTTFDLITAIAAGGAGAYGLSRPDVSDSLPGVAIAISLVPPLTVVGIAWSQGDFDGGAGALLLFATNMVAILVVGGLTFILTGVTPIDHAARSSDRVRVGFSAVAVMTVLVLGGLLLNGQQLASDALRQDTIDDVLATWIPDDTGHRLVESDVKNDVVTAVVIGPSEGLPDVGELADQLSADLDDTITARVSLIVEEQLVAVGGE